MHTITRSSLTLLKVVMLGTVLTGLVACTTPSRIQKTVYDDGEVLETLMLKTQHLKGIGQFREIPVKGSKTPNVVYPKYEVTDGIQRIPAQLNHGFSITLAVYGQASGKRIYPVEIHHPSFTLPDGRQEKVWKGGMLVRSTAALGIGELGYLFNHAYEVVPGPWEVRVFHRNKIIAQQTFDVYPVTTTPVR